MELPLVGTILNSKYKIQKTIGEGSFAVVYLASTLTTNTNVAIKCLFKRGLSQSQLLLQQQEVQILLSLRGVPNVIQLLETIETPDYSFIVLEYCQVDLFDSIMNNTFNEHESKQIFIQLATAVAACHSRGIYHRDLKPENVLLKNTLNPIVRLADFGLATRDLLSTDFGCGSIRYMAPEVMKASKMRFNKFKKAPYLSPANDVWSLAVILINLLTKKNPWVEPTEKDDHFNTHLLKDLTAKDSFREQFNFSQEFCQLLRMCFDLNPENRPSCKEMLEMVQSLDGFFYREKRSNSVYVPSHRKSQNMALLTPPDSIPTLIQAQWLSFNRKYTFPKRSPEQKKQKSFGISPPNRFGHQNPYGSPPHPKSPSFGFQKRTPQAFSSIENLKREFGKDTSFSNHSEISMFHMELDME